MTDRSNPNPDPDAPSIDERAQPVDDGTSEFPKQAATATGLFLPAVIVLAVAVIVILYFVLR